MTDAETRKLAAKYIVQTEDIEREDIERKE
jgi:hypothetical protein